MLQLHQEWHPAGPFERRQTMIYTEKKLPDSSGMNKIGNKNQQKTNLTSQVVIRHIFLLINNNQIGF